MKLPWTNQTGLAKAAAILATILLVSTGLCGANLIAVLTVRNHNSLAFGLGITAEVELFGIAVSILGLSVVGVITIVKVIKSAFTNSSKG